MAIKEFSIGCSRTINLGNFQSLRFEASVTVDLQPGEDLAKAQEEAQKKLSQLLEETYEAQYKFTQSLI